MTRPYDYNELREKAESGKQEDINNLGKWLEMYGDKYWNGEYYDADGLRIYPEYTEVEPDVYDLTGWRAEP